jgi:hypothetical protein
MRCTKLRASRSTSAPTGSTTIDLEPAMARQAFAVNEAVRERVRHLAGVGVRQDDIARIIGCSPKTLRPAAHRRLDGIDWRNSGFYLAARGHRLGVWPCHRPIVCDSKEVILSSTSRQQAPMAPPAGAGWMVIGRRTGGGSAGAARASRSRGALGGRRNGNSGQPPSPAAKRRPCKNSSRSSGLRQYIARGTTRDVIVRSRLTISRASSSRPNCA